MHTGERRGEKEAEGVKKAKKCEGDEERSDGGEREWQEEDEGETSYVSYIGLYMV